MTTKAQLQEQLTEKGIAFPEDATKSDLEALLSVKKSIVPENYKARYKAHGGNCGDDMAEVLNDAVKDEKGKVVVSALEDVMAANGIEKSKWAERNIGQRRMNLGNVLRSRIKNGTAVTVGETVWNEGAEAVTA